MKESRWRHPLAAKSLESLLHEEQGSARLPGIWDSRVEDDLVIQADEAILFDPGREVDTTAGDEVPVQGTVESGEAPAEIEAAVIAAAGEHGWIAKRQILPTGVVRQFPEGSIQQGAGIGGRATAPTGALFRGQERFQERPLLRAEEGIREGWES